MSHPGTFLDKKRPHMKPGEEAAGDAILLTFSRMWKHGTDPVWLIERIQTKAIARIQELGDHQAFANEVNAKFRETDT